ncbi:BQ5605_C003g02180 [Microbotryum silenes-dioicae]|uniref:BQ5605_C003g02180 protein n=1 Tax=Microbotryum silenes-dioicae TaxID=796604 RepID=A0A2X0P3J1_9BASI|nr:BQ5605_C003g02180 [Microbotryum silenes-dioicae]
MYAVEPLQEYELADRALRPALIPEPGVPLLPALPQVSTSSFSTRTMVRSLLFLYQLAARWPKGLKTKEEPIDHRREEAVEAVNSYEDDDPAERDPPLPPDDGHEYRPYRVGRTPGLLENINEGNTLPLIALVSTSHPPLPKTFKDAMASPEAESWYAASVKELNSMGLHKVFKLSSPPTGARALGYRWVFTRKEDAEGNIINYKAQLVVQGFAPRVGIDYNKMLALVSNPERHEV